MKKIITLGMIVMLIVTFSSIANANSCNLSCDEYYDIALQNIAKKEKYSADLVARYCKPPIINPKSPEFLKKALISLSTSNCKNAKSIGNTTSLKEEAENRRKTCYDYCTKNPAAPNPSPTKSQCDKPNSLLTVTSYTPKEVDAGKFDRQDSEGMATYVPATYDLTIKGTCLDDLTMTSSSLGIDKQPAVANIKPGSLSGDQQNFTITINPNAVAGPSSIKLSLSNKYGKNKDITLDVNIFGDQYLNRKFATSATPVTFMGHWEKAGTKTFALEKEIQKGIDFISRGDYAKLGIKIKVYEKAFWDSTMMKKLYPKADFGDNYVYGMTTPNDNIINIVETIGPEGYSYSKLGYNIDLGPSGLILHESVHKLHYCQQGKYSFGSASCNKNIDKEWHTAIGDLSKCTYIPIKSSLKWKDGTNLPRCGFVEPYGANGAGTGFWGIGRRDAEEDIATFVMAKKFNPVLLLKGDALSAVYRDRYTKKIKLLVDYGFLPI